MKKALLILEDGSQFYGRSIGSYGESVGEIVFNTSMTGYQEILSDPSYSNQIITFTYPHIGNVGINILDNESFKIQAAGLVVHSVSLIASNFRCTLSLSEFLIQQNIVGISDVDTRKLTRLIREKGTQYACIMTNDILDITLALDKIRKFSELRRLNLAYKVSTSQQYIWNKGTCWNLKYKPPSTVMNLLYHVVVYDFGVKKNILRILVDYKCLLTVVPANTDPQEVIDINPDGILLSNGPGDPNEYTCAIDTVRTFLFTTRIPIFGICLGYQLLALANGAKILRMKFGHHGSNHPVKDVESNKIIITTQNHNFVVDIKTLPNTLKITHLSLFDRTLQGVRHIYKPAYGFQGHPESSPGTHDAISIFNYFIKLIKNYRQDSS